MWIWRDWSVLDSDTKRKIDTLRDILVGKIPNPQSQVEQITTGLIYKFMDDMDQEAVELGGEKSFFTGDYEKYAWKNLFDSKLGGEEKVKLYSEAVENMYLNPTAPQLFREIFKNAFLPFKDPSTLNMFLKEIDEFHYSHSEKLGDAFEYLLSFMGSQGDAGQFRTPRHIIDFIVEIVNPQKHESVLDPACGSAGFLISSYKHILKTNTDKRLGDKLSSEDRKKVGNNLNGYDISPEMIRLSLVNMYLHGFQTPKIEEYDTLSSEDKWNEYYDVIFANPPFFSPKGGIQPHNRFGVSSNKAEVLFTSYILDHLKPDGRAGIIVPEGIIFQSTTKAYIELRKQLIEHGLVGVISLPAGVFNPYSGVKTSILILDKELNQKSNSIFFAKVDNDGFSLGAQRAAIAKNDLPSLLGKFNEFLLGNFSMEECIEKASILETNDYSFSAGKYLAKDITLNSDYPTRALRDICEIIMGQSPKSEFYNEHGEGLEFHQGKSNFGNIQLESSGVWSSQYNKVAEENSILMSVRAPVGPVNITNRKIALGRGLCAINSNQDCYQMYLFYLLQSSVEKLKQSSHGSTFNSINRNELLEFEIPLPPLEVQQEIVDELEGYQKIIDGCKQVIENYKPTIDIDPSWEMIELGEICDVGSSKRIYKNEYVSEGVPFYRTKEVVELNKGKDLSLELFISPDRFKEIREKYGKPQKDDILISAVGTIGVSWVVDRDFDFYFKDGNLLWLKNISPDVQSIFLKTVFDSIFKGKKDSLVAGSAYNALTIITLKNFKVPLPDKRTQEEIVKKIEEERKVIEGNKKLIEIYTQKIQDRINKVWGK